MALSKKRAIKIHNLVLELANQYPKHSYIARLSLLENQHIITNVEATIMIKSTYPN